jgi:hypothetical protein
VAKIQTRDVSASAPSSGQLLVWSGSAWTPSGAPTLTGDVIIPAAYLVTAGTGVTTSGTSLVTYITATTPSLAAGTYDVEWRVVMLHSASGSTFGAQLTLGTTQVPTAVIDGPGAPASNARTSISSGGTYVHTGGTLVVLLQVRRASGTGNITAQSGKITLQRIQ